MSNRLYGKDRTDIAHMLEEADFFDHVRIKQEAEIMRGEALARMFGRLWRAAHAARRRLFSTQAVGHDAAASPR